MQKKSKYTRTSWQNGKREKKNGVKKSGGKPPNPPEPGPKPHDQVNLTDEESRIMPASGGGFLQAFNAQACVDIATMLIVAAHTTQQPNDKKQIEPALEALGNLPEELGQVSELLADTGYYSQANVEACEAAGINPLIAVSREAHNQKLEDRFSEPEPVSETADGITKMRYRSKSKEGKGSSLIYVGNPKLSLPLIR
jgi:hypothetical protein